MQKNTSNRYRIHSYFTLHLYVRMRVDESPLSGHVLACFFIRFITFKLESHHSCFYDFVSVYNGDRITYGKRIAQFCGSQLPPPVVSSTNKMLIHFASDLSRSHRGFLAEYSQVPSIGK